MKPAILLLAVAGIEAVMRSQTSLGLGKTGLRHRFLDDARRLGAALRQSSPAEAAAAYRRLQHANADAARALHEGAHGTSFVVMPVPLLMPAPILDNALEDVGEDFRAMSQNFGAFDRSAFDEGFFAQPMAFAGHGPQFEPFDTFGALRNITGWTRSSEFRSANGTSLQRICENGNCTEIKRVCHGGACTETARSMPTAELHAKPASSIERSPSDAGAAVDRKRPMQLEHGPLDIFDHDIFDHDLFNSDRLFDHGIFDDSREWPEMQLRAPLLHFPQHNESGHVASSSYSESTETRMENGQLYKKVCRNGKCTETNRKCANWNCSDGM